MRAQLRYMATGNQAERADIQRQHQLGDLKHTVRAAAINHMPRP